MTPPFGGGRQGRATGAGATNPSFTLRKDAADPLPLVALGDVADLGRELLTRCCTPRAQKDETQRASVAAVHGRFYDRTWGLVAHERQPSACGLR